LFLSTVKLVAEKCSDENNINLH